MIVAIIFKTSTVILSKWQTFKNPLKIILPANTK